MSKTTRIDAGSTSAVAVMVVVVLCLLVATFIWILISVQALLARSNQERAKAEKVVEQMTSDLKNRLEPLGHLEVLEQTLLALLPLYKEQSDDLEYERHRGTLSVLMGDIYLPQGKLEEALRSYGEGRKIRQALLDKHPGETNCQIDVTESLSAMGNVYRAMGRLDEALSLFDESLKMRKKLKDTLKEQTAMAGRYAECLYDIGDTLLIIGKFDQAQQRYDEGLSCLEEVFKANSSPENRAALATGLCTQGDRLRAQGKTSDALARYKQSEAHRRTLVSSFPNNVYWESGLAVTLSCLGDTHRTLGALNGAMTEYTESFGIRKNLASIEPKNVVRLEECAVGYSNMGDIYLATGQLELALQEFDEGLNIRRGIATNSDDLNLKADLAVGLANRGDALLAFGRPNEALKAYEEGLKTRLEILGKDSKNVVRMADAAIGFLNVGDALLNRNFQGDVNAAIDKYEQSVNIREDLVRREPSNMHRQIELAVSRENLGEAQLRLDNADTALELFDLSKPIVEQRRPLDKDNVRLAQVVARTYLRTGRAYAALKRDDDARSAFRQAAAILDAQGKNKLDFYGQKLRKDIEAELTRLP